MILKLLLLVLLAEVWATAGQVLFKKSTNTLQTPDLKNWDSYARFVRKVLGIPGIWLGLGAMALGLVVWLVALAQNDLSLVFPIGSLQYILILIAARLFLGEKIDRMKLAGTLLIVAGIVLITLS